ncbi:hypothetical protein [Aliihoeflea sp. 2WW]|uniref:hypothetical protein n=1 Tax=Aliihoeflea sp. 2WW TaxID=1381123 RepID=UPI0004B5F05B|nr:hypothetical protein [Aliihoeflea sp. 2WW]
MANFIFVVACAQHSEEIARFFAGPDLVTSELGAGNRFFYLSRDAHNDHRGGGADFFKGHAIDHAQRKLIFSGAGEAPEVTSPVEGAYLRAQQIGDAVVVGNDVFSQLPLLHFSDDGVSAISDSLFALTRLRRVLGLPVQIDERAVIGRAWINSISGQVLSERTSVDGVRYALPGTKLKIDKASAKLTVDRTPAREFFKEETGDYAETIRDGAQRVIALMATMLQVPNSMTGISLSGGADSRMLLAAALAVDPERRTRINSNVKAKRDFSVATDLSKAFHFDLNGPSRVPLSFQRLDQISQWMLSCAGIYDPMYSLSMKTKNLTFFSVAGHGAELYKGNYGWRSVEAVNATIPEAEGAFKAEVADGLAAMDVDPADPWGSEWHYIGYRNGLHGGRSTMTSLVSVKPLFHRSLVGVCHSPANEYPAPRKSQPSMATDLLIAMNPELAKHPFDEDFKNLEASYVDERSRYLGRVETSEAYEIVGSPADVHAGPPNQFFQMAESEGLTGSFTDERLLGLLDRALETAPGSISSAMAPMVMEAKKLRELPSNDRSRTATGKLLSFLHLA